MGGTDVVVLKGLLRYLEDEWNSKERGGDKFNKDDWELVHCPVDIPRQNNGELLCVLSI